MTSLTRRLFRRATPQTGRRRFQPSIQHLERRDTPAPFTPGNLVIYRMGEGGAIPLSNTGSAVFLDEYTRTGTLVQSIAMPATGPAPLLISSGTATTEGLLTLSPDGHFLALAGYNTAVGSSTAALPGTPTTSVTRSAAIVDAMGSSTITAFTNAFSGGNPRGATTSDGSRVWLSGSNTGVLTGVVSGPTATATTVSTTNTNLRGIGIFNGQLYDTSGAGSIRIGQVGTGLPTATGTATTALPGVPTTAAIYNGFSILDMDATVPGVDTLYVAEEGTGFVKFSFDGTTWTLRGSINVPNSQLRGLTAHKSGNCVLLYGTNSTGTNGTLFALTDTSGSSTGTLTGSPVAIATAALNTAFRGVAFTPSLNAPNEVLNIDTPATTISNSATFTVTFNTQVLGLTASNLALATTGDVAGVIGTPNTVDGGLTWTVPVTGVSGDGTLRLDLVNSTGLTPTVYFLPFACGKTVTVNNTPAVATLDVVNGVATYFGTPGFNNNVNFSGLGSNYQLSDVENITLTSAAMAAGFTGGGGQTVQAINASSITQFRVVLGAGSDTFTINSIDIPLTAFGGGNAGDNATFNGGVNVNGKVSLTGFDSISQSPGIIINASIVELTANQIGTFVAPINTKSDTVSALGGAGGVFVVEENGANFTLRATDAGELNITNKTGSLNIAGASTFGTGPVNLSSGDEVAVNAGLGDGTSEGTITVQANTDGQGTQGYLQGVNGNLSTKATGTAISISVNPFGGNGHAVLGTGTATGANANITVTVNDGNILWNPGFTIPALNTANAKTLGAFLFNFNATGIGSVGSAASPIQLSAGQGGQTVANAGVGGIYLTDWGSGESNFTATATETGNIQIWTGNATNNGIIVVSPGITTGSGLISLRADDNLFVNGKIGGSNFSGPVFMEANLDGQNSQSIKMSNASNSITTSNASAQAVIMNTYSQADTFGGGTVGGVVLSNITTGNGGVVVINTGALLGNATDAKRAGAITALDNMNFINTGSGMVILTAKDNGIGTDNSNTNALQLNITAQKITAIANSVGSSSAGVNQFDGSIFINSTTGTSFSGVTTTAGTMIGRIDLTANGPVRLHGDVKTTDGSITLTSPTFILQDGGVISTTGTLTLNYGAAALLTGANSVGTLVIPPQRDLVVNGTLAAATPITIAGGKLSGTGKVSDVIITMDGAVEGNVAPGNSPGILGSGSITWSGGNRFSVEVSGGTAGTGYDQLIVTGTVDIGNASLDASDPTFLYAPAPGAKHYLVLNDGSEAVTGTFKAFPEGAIVSINAVNYTISYVGNGDGGSVGNDVVLIAPGMAGPPPTMTGSVGINGGGQRSMVQTLTITFSEPVVLSPGAFKVEGTALGPIGDVGLNVVQIGNTVTLTFNNTGVAIDPANSLKDGKYKLTMFADKISGAGGTLDGNGNAVSNGSPTDDVSFTFHRLFGDADGNGSVSAADFAQFRSFFGLAGPSIFDFNGDNNTNATDFAQFRARFGLGGYLP